MIIERTLLDRCEHSESQKICLTTWTFQNSIRSEMWRTRYSSGKDAPAQMRSVRTGSALLCVKEAGEGTVIYSYYNRSDHVNGD